MTRACTCPATARTTSLHDAGCPALWRPGDDDLQRLTDRERACLRGEHEPLTAEDANGVFPRTFVGRLAALVCRHCRCLYAARAA